MPFMIAYSFGGLYLMDPYFFLHLHCYYLQCIIIYIFVLGIIVSYTRFDKGMNYIQRWSCFLINIRHIRNCPRKITFFRTMSFSRYFIIRPSDHHKLFTHYPCMTHKLLAKFEEHRTIRYSENKELLKDVLSGHHNASIFLWRRNNAMTSWEIVTTYKYHQHALNCLRQVSYI